MNATSIIAICFEQMIVAAVQEAKPRMTDPEVAAEATAFLRQEAQHSSSHRKHVNALIKHIPGLQQTLDNAMARFDRLTANTSLNFRLAYIADLEATSRRQLQDDARQRRRRCFAPAMTAWPHCSCGTSSKRSSTAARRC